MTTRTHKKKAHAHNGWTFELLADFHLLLMCEWQNLSFLIPNLLVSFHISCFSFMGSNKRVVLLLKSVDNMGGKRGKLDSTSQQPSTRKWIHSNGGLLRKQLHENFYISGRVTVFYRHIDFMQIWNYLQRTCSVNENRRNGQETTPDKAQFWNFLSNVNSATKVRENLRNSEWKNGRLWCETLNLQICFNLDLEFLRTE